MNCDRCINFDVCSASNRSLGPEAEHCSYYKDKSRFIEKEEPKISAAERIKDAGFDEVILFCNPSYEDALIGITEDGRAVYDYQKMVAWLVEHDGMNEEDAEEWIAYNTIGALPYAGGGAPIIMYPL